MAFYVIRNGRVTTSTSTPTAPTSSTTSSTTSTTTSTTSTSSTPTPTTSTQQTSSVALLQKMMEQKNSNVLSPKANQQAALKTLQATRTNIVATQSAKKQPIGKNRGRENVEYITENGIDYKVINGKKYQMNHNLPTEEEMASKRFNVLDPSLKTEKLNLGIPGVSQKPTGISTTSTGGSAKAAKVGITKTATTTTWDISQNLKDVQAQAKKYGVNIAPPKTTSYKTEAAAQKALDNYVNSVNKALESQANKSIAATNSQAAVPITRGYYEGLTPTQRNEVDSWNQNNKARGINDAINPDWVVWNNEKLGGAEPPKYWKDATNSTQLARDLSQARRDAELVESQRKLQESYDAVQRAAGTTHARNTKAVTNNGKSASQIFNEQKGVKPSSTKLQVVGAGVTVPSVRAKSQPVVVKKSVTPIPIKKATQTKPTIVKSSASKPVSVNLANKNNLQRTQALKAASHAGQVQLKDGTWISQYQKTGASNPNSGKTSIFSESAKERYNTRVSNARAAQAAFEANRSAASGGKLVDSRGFAINQITDKAGNAKISRNTLGQAVTISTPVVVAGQKAYYTRGGSQTASDQREAEKNNYLSLLGAKYRQADSTTALLNKKPTANTFAGIKPFKTVDQIKHEKTDAALESYRQEHKDSKVALAAASLYGATYDRQALKETETAGNAYWSKNVVARVLPTTSAFEQKRNAAFTKVGLEDERQAISQKIYGNIVGKAALDTGVNTYNFIREKPVSTAKEVAVIVGTGAVLGAGFGAAKIATKVGFGKIASKVASPTWKKSITLTGNYLPDAYMLGSMGKGLKGSYDATFKTADYKALSVADRELVKQDYAAGLVGSAGEMVIGWKPFSRGSRIGETVTSKTIAAIESNPWKLVRKPAELDNALPGDFDVTNVAQTPWEKANRIIAADAERIKAIAARKKQLSETQQVLETQLRNLKGENPQQIKALRQQINAIAANQKNAEVVASLAPINRAGLKDAAFDRQLSILRKEAAEQAARERVVVRNYMPTTEATLNLALNAFNSAENMHISNLKTGYSRLKTPAPSTARRVLSANALGRKAISVGKTIDRKISVVENKVRNTENNIKRTLHIPERQMWKVSRRNIPTEVIATNPKITALNRRLGELQTEYGDPAILKARIAEHEARGATTEAIQVKKQLDEIRSVQTQLDALNLAAKHSTSAASLRKQLIGKPHEDLRADLRAAAEQRSIEFAKKKARQEQQDMLDVADRLSEPYQGAPYRVYEKDLKNAFKSSNGLTAALKRTSETANRKFSYTSSVVKYTATHPRKIVNDKLTAVGSEITATRYRIRDKADHNAAHILKNAEIDLGRAEKALETARVQNEVAKEAYYMARVADAKVKLEIAKKEATLNKVISSATDRPIWFNKPNGYTTQKTIDSALKERELYTSQGNVNMQEALTKATHGNDRATSNLMNLWDATTGNKAAFDAALNRKRSWLGHFNGNVRKRTFVAPKSRNPSGAVRFEQRAEFALRSRYQLGERETAIDAIVEVKPVDTSSLGFKRRQYQAITEAHKRLQKQMKLEGKQFEAPSDITNVVGYAKAKSETPFAKQQAKTHIRESIHKVEQKLRADVRATRAFEAYPRDITDVVGTRRANVNINSKPLTIKETAAVKVKNPGKYDVNKDSGDVWSSMKARATEYNESQAMKIAKQREADNRRFEQNEKAKLMDEVFEADETLRAINATLKDNKSTAQRTRTEKQRIIHDRARERYIQKLVAKRRVEAEYRESPEGKAKLEAQSEAHFNRWMDAQKKRGIIMENFRSQTLPTDRAAKDEAINNWFEGFSIRQREHSARREYDRSKRVPESKTEKDRAVNEWYEGFSKSQKEYGLKKEAERAKNAIPENKEAKDKVVSEWFDGFAKKQREYGEKKEAERARQANPTVNNPSTTSSKIFAKQNPSLKRRDPVAEKQINEKVAAEMAKIDESKFTGKPTTKSTSTTKTGDKILEADKRKKKIFEDIRTSGSNDTIDVGGLRLRVKSEIKPEIKTESIPVKKRRGMTKTEEKIIVKNQAIHIDAVERGNKKAEIEATKTENQKVKQEQKKRVREGYAASYPYVISNYNDWTDEYTYLRTPAGGKTGIASRERTAVSVNPFVGSYKGLDSGNRGFRDSYRATETRIKPPTVVPIKTNAVKPIIINPVKPETLNIVKPDTTTITKTPVVPKTKTAVISAIKPMVSSDTPTPIVPKLKQVYPTQWRAGVVFGQEQAPKRIKREKDKDQRNVMKAARAKDKKLVSKTNVASFKQMYGAAKKPRATPFKK